MGLGLSGDLAGCGGLGAVGGGCGGHAGQAAQGGSQALQAAGWVERYEEAYHLICIFF